MIEGKERDRMAFGAAFLKLLERGRVELKKWIEALLECGGTKRYHFRNLEKVESIICREVLEQLLSHNGSPYK